MNALARTDYAPWSLSEAVVSDFIRKGAHVFEDPLSARACAELVAEIADGRRFDQSLFLDEGDSLSGGTAAGWLLERLEPKLAFVERAPQIVEALWSLLGPDYRIIDKAVVCDLPDHAVPTWLKRLAHSGQVGDLTRFVRPDRRDVVCAWGEDFHQNVVEDRIAPAEIVTLDVCLQGADAGVRLLEGSHRMGVSTFPHDLKRSSGEGWRYRTATLGEMFVTERALPTETGSVALWHACTLHAADRPVEQPRIALRYLIARGAGVSTGIDAVNRSLAGPLGSV